MSCANTKDKKLEPKIIKFDCDEERAMVGGKPCIDFQPDDRWQIKDEDEKAEKVKPNTKIKGMKANSNGPAKRNLRSTKSKEPAVNGESVGSSSEDETKVKAESISVNNLKRERTRKSESQCNNKSSKKRSADEIEENKTNNGIEKKKLKVEIKVADKTEANAADKTETNAASKTETNTAGKTETNTADKIEANDADKVEPNDLDKTKISDSPESKQINNDPDEEKNMPSLSPEAVEINDKTPEETKDDLNVSIEIIEEEDKKSVVDSEDNSEVLPKLEEFKKSDSDIKTATNKISNSDNKNVEVKIVKVGEAVNSSSDGKKDSEIEVININDESKKSNASDDESDSEIQIISADVTKTFPEKFPDIEPPSDSLGQTAGYPFYNSLREKVKGFKAGEYKPVKFPHTGTLMLGESEVIIESPSLLVPLLIKETDSFPKLEGQEIKVSSDQPTTTKPNMISKKNFFQSSVGQFLINLGMSRVQEWYHRDLKRSKLKQLKSRSQNDKKLEEAVETYTKKHAELKARNGIFNFRMRRCHSCGFTSESRVVMEGHYLMPHLTPRKEFKCNFCDFLTRDTKDIVFHYEAMHGKKAVLDVNIPFHECIFCSFQSHLKTKVNAHMNRCRKHFIPAQNLSPPFDFEFPGVTTKPVTITDVVAHRRLLLTSSKNRIPMPDDNSPHGAYARKKIQSVLTKMTAQGNFPDMKSPSLMKQLMTSQTGFNPALTSSSIQLPPGLVITRPRGALTQMRPGLRYAQPRAIGSIRGTGPRRGTLYTGTLTSAATQLASSGISITPVSRPGAPPRVGSITAMKNVTLTPVSAATNRTVSQKPGPPQPVALFTNVAGSTGLIGQPAARLPSINVNVRPPRSIAPYQRLNTPPSQVVKGSSGNTFVMCEICDSYIKDLEELRSHMNHVHKVKIHPKMLVSRPPLNCQKCHWRFFTDQGLERHLLGAHGLVTTNMQEMANKNQDGGRCIICGAVFTYKLVSHMTQVHKVTLKPAHLSYKCTVCTATFTLYRLFESHVYNVHSGSAKRPAEEPVVEPPAKKATPEVRSDSGARRCKDCSMVTESMHDHLVKCHLKECFVKLCRIEKCEKCLYSSDEMLVIRMSDFGLDEDVDDSSGDSSSEDDSEEETDTKMEESVDVEASDQSSTKEA